MMTLQSNIETIINPVEEITQVIERGLHDHNRSALGAELFYNFTRMAQSRVVSRTRSPAE